jgi:hypothetical protein
MSKRKVGKAEGKNHFEDLGVHGKSGKAEVK